MAALALRGISGLGFREVLAQCDERKPGADARRVFAEALVIARECKTEKVDAFLDKLQMERQMAAATDGDWVLYVLLGTCRFSWSESKIEVARQRCGRAPAADCVRVVDLRAMRDAVATLASHATDPDHSDLAVAYDGPVAAVLQTLDGSFHVAISLSGSSAGPVPLTNDRTWSDGSPSFSPDGSLVVFGRYATLIAKERGGKPILCGYLRDRLRGEIVTKQVDAPFAFVM